VKKILLFAVISVLIVSVSVTSIYAQSQYEIPAWVKGIANFWVEGNISDSEFGESISFLIEQNILQVEMPETDDSQNINKIRNLAVENSKLKAENKKLKAENKELQNTIDILVYQPPSSPYDDISSPSGYRYDVDSFSNIGGLNVNLHSFGFMEPKPDEFSIDVSVEYTRGGSLVQFEVSQVRVKTDNHFTYEADKTEFLEFNGYYKEGQVNRGIVTVDDVPRDFESDFEILILIREIENKYYVQDYIFTFPYNIEPRYPWQ